MGMGDGPRRLSLLVHELLTVALPHSDQELVDTHRTVPPHEYKRGERGGRDERINGYLPAKEGLDLCLSDGSRVGAVVVNE